MNTQRVAIITAASRGIGAGCARELAARGYKVSLIARNQSIFDLAAELSGIATQGSIANAEDLQQLVETTLSQFGRIDAVVNNFGDPPRPELLSISDEMWQENFEMLFLSVVRMARLVTEPMRQQGGGAIVNISACDSREPELGTPFSGTLRAAMEGFTKLYAKRYRADKIRMNSVAPFFVADSMEELIGWNVPSDLMYGRPATYVELAKTVAFLISDDAKFVSGTTLKVDEAYSAAI
ncbi:SDR family oxidoreductase [Chroococcidiopsis sp. CCNUC1]|jgi:NAD(P)-dependent dehydrogenase (short-subunit alcohol dehydrogenase family)|uniref:SDR family oxidoreductase n=1 Tax=Chroococcidiopsis sp. CCNUC1 TaxID=2653189 RepID=UPI000D0512E6|nr:SDR family oxidoreductase [Chroococcidiopsis sp. CCNUC1]PSB43852.1 oxidoreductase [Cyanosarcina cf. burmensis CCALA 770]URD49006.1 SDR family oxidoreductase [Chroococcidiopsis sp. CCNUC1]